MITHTKIYEMDDKEVESFEQGMQHLTDVFLETKENKKYVYFIGNGGSAAIAIHMTADFFKNGNMKAVSLYDSAAMTCLGNDYGYEYVFEKQVERLGDKGDLLVAISSSGNSKNIVNTIEAAKGKNMNVITFSGFDKDNAIRVMGDYNLHVPIRHYGIVESVHNLILQQIVDVISEK